MKNLASKEPVVLIGLLCSAIVLVAGHFGLVLDSASVQSVVEPLVVSVLARQFVTPAIRTVVDEAEDLAEKVKH
jgi:hypothetical protein